MSMLRAYFFGRIRLTQDDSQVDIKIPPIIQSLLAYLLLYRDRTHPRYVLANLFWGENRHEYAHGCLNTALWRLRQILEPKGTPNGTFLRVTRGGEIGINRDSPLWLDLSIFEEQVDRILAKSVVQIETQDILRLESTDKLYQGELLEGFDDDWVLCERERLHIKYLNSLVYLMQFYALQDNPEKSLAYCQKILAIDPLREEIHRSAMRLHMQKGDRAQAVRQYKACEALLSKELGIPPMEETQELYRQLLAGAARPIIPDGSPDAFALLARLNSAVQDLEAAQSRLASSIQELKTQFNTLKNTQAPKQ